MNCLECGIEVKQTPGKKAKLYCNEVCRFAHWKKKKILESGKPARGRGRPTKAVLPISDSQQKELKVVIPDIGTALDQQIKYDPNKSFDISKKVHFEDEPLSYSKKIEYEEGESHRLPDEEIKEMAEKTFNDHIQSQIRSIKAEKIPPHRDTIIGRKSWALDQKNRIQELESKLK